MPAYRLDEADVIVSFGGDFLEAWPSPVMYGQQFGEFRQGPRRTQGEHGRFFYVGPRMSQTAAKADVWLPCNPGTEAIVAQGLAAALGGGSVTQAAQASGLTEQQITDMATAFRAAGTRAVAVAGNGLLNSPDATAAFTAVESPEHTGQEPVRRVRDGGDCPRRPHFWGGRVQGVQALIQADERGAGRGAGDLGAAQPGIHPAERRTILRGPLARVPFVAALTPFEDETTALADVLLPTRSFLEEWSDDIPAVIPAGTRMATLRQPIVDPQFIGGNGQATDHLAPFVPWMDTRPLGDLLIHFLNTTPIAGPPLPDQDTRDAVRRTWAGIGQADLAETATDNDAKWVAALAQGGVWTQGTVKIAPPAHPNNRRQFCWGRNSSTHARTQHFRAAPVPAPLLDGRAAREPAVDAGERGLHDQRRLELLGGDQHGRGAPTGHPHRGHRAGGDGARDTWTFPPSPTPACTRSALAMPIGQGHAAYGRSANGRGGNPLAILDPIADTQTGALAYGATRVTLTKIASAEAGYNGPQTLVLSQDRPGGAEPEAVQELIHTTAKEWKQAPPVNGSPQAEGSIFNRKGRQNNNPKVKGGRSRKSPCQTQTEHPHPQKSRATKGSRTNWRRSAPRGRAAAAKGRWRRRRRPTSSPSRTGASRASGR